MTSPCREMPRYKCHKEVWALKIKALELRDNPITSDRKETFGSALGQLWLHPEDEGFASFQVNDDWRQRWQAKAEPGGYFVVYDDGYESYSPAAAFDAGYTKI